jgi:hypothetical protein
MAEATKSGSQSGSSSSGSGSGSKASAQDKTDRALSDERTQDEGVETTDEGVAYPTSQAPPPKQETPDKVSYRDPRPLDWPQKADRSVFIGAVHSIDADDDGGEKKGYVYAGKVREEEELELGGTGVETAQVVAGSGQLVVILDGKAFNLSGLGGQVQADLSKGLEYNANS